MISNLYHPLSIDFKFYCKAFCEQWNWGIRKLYVIHIRIHFFYFQAVRRPSPFKFISGNDPIYISQGIERNRNFISLKIRQFVSLFTSGEIVWRGENAETISVHANYFVHSSMYFFVVCGFGMKLWLLFLNVLLFSFLLHIYLKF